MTASQRRLAPLAAALIATFAAPALAQAGDADRIRELEKKLERSLEMIEKLSEKITRLEQSGTPAAKETPQAARIEQIERHVSEIGASLSRRSLDAGVAMHGFADVGLQRVGENNPTARGRKGAALGTLDLYLTPSFGRVKTLIELAFHGQDSGMAEAELERMQVGYTFSDAATGWIGRFHTPYGYWNTAFHHGAQIQTSISRPQFLEFEDDGGILPAHTVGGWLTGSFQQPAGRVGYDLFVGNAPQINGVGAATAPTPLAASHPAGFSAVVNAGGYAGAGELTMRQAGSASHRTSTGGNVWFEPAAVDGLRLGLHGLRTDVVDDAAAPNHTRVRMGGGYFAYHGEPWEVLGEFYRFRNQDKSGGTGTHASWAGYLQAGYNLGKWTPYVRAERAKLDQTDNYFGVQEGSRSYRRAVAGLRYDVDALAALKLEFASYRKEDLGPGLTDRFPELRFQYAIRF